MKAKEKLNQKDKELELPKPKEKKPLSKRKKAIKRIQNAMGEPNQLIIKSKKRREFCNRRRRLYEDLIKRMLYNSFDINNTEIGEYVQYIQETYGVSQDTAIEYIQQTKSILALNLNEYAQEAITKNYLRLEDIIGDAYTEEDKQTLLKALDMENKMLAAYGQRTFELQTNPNDNTIKFRITLGNEE